MSHIKILGNSLLGNTILGNSLIHHHSNLISLIHIFVHSGNGYIDVSR